MMERQFLLDVVNTTIRYRAESGQFFKCGAAERIADKVLADPAVPTTCAAIQSALLDEVMEA